MGNSQTPRSRSSVPLLDQLNNTLVQPNFMQSDASSGNKKVKRTQHEIFMSDRIEKNDLKITTVKLDEKGKKWDVDGQKKLMSAKFHNRFAEVVQVVADGTNLKVADHIQKSKKKKVETVTSALPNIAVQTRNQFKKSALRAADRVGLEKKFGEASPYRTASQMVREFDHHLRDTCDIFLPPNDVFRDVYFGSNGPIPKDSVDDPDRKENGPDDYLEDELNEEQKAQKLREEEEKMIQQLKEKKNGAELAATCRGLPAEIERDMMLFRIKAKATFPGLQIMIPRLKRSVRLALRDAYQRGKGDAEGELDRLKRLIIQKNVKLAELEAQLEALREAQSQPSSAEDAPQPQPAHQPPAHQPPVSIGITSMLSSVSSMFSSRPSNSSSPIKKRQRLDVEWCLDIPQDSTHMAGGKVGFVNGTWKVMKSGSKMWLKPNQEILNWILSDIAHLRGAEVVV